MNKKPLLCLIDGAGYYFRAYYAIRQYLSNSKGQPTNAIFGFANMLRKILKDQNPDYALMVFDSKEKTFRHEMYELYKANRPEMPEDLAAQLPYIDKLLHAHNMPIARMPGYEADDIIGAVAGRAADDGFEVVIVTSDKDLMQLVRAGVTLFDGMKDKVIGPEQVMEKFGVEPSLVADVLGLMGDSSDNIPGVPGVGEKTAKALVQDMGPLEKILEKAAALTKKKLRENLIEFADQARLSKKLATIDMDAPIEFEPEKWKVAEPNTEALRELYSELEFSAMIKELGSDKPKVDRDYQLVTSMESFKEMITELQASPGFAVDTETTSKYPTQATLVGMSFSCKEGRAYYLPLRHRYVGAPEQLDLEDIKPALQDILENSKIEKYGQNIKYDMIVLASEGLSISPVSFDTMIASYLINPASKHGLSDLACDHLGEEMIEYEEVCGKGAKQILFDEVEVERAQDYAAEDADITYRLVELMRPIIKKQGMEKLLYEVEIPLMLTLAEIEMVGVAIDSAMLGAMGDEIEKELQGIEVKIYALAGGKFNINSPKQMGAILFDKLKLPGGKKTKTGFSTSQSVLEDLAAVHPLPDLALEYRQLSKLKSTYIDALPKMVNQKSGRIHSSFNQTVAATGRLSSSDPNLQNIPIRTNTGAKIRQAFIAPKGHKLVSADYSQIELRLLAHFSGEPALREAFENNEDIHARTAAEISGIHQGLVSEDMRRMAKTVNFGIIYGQTAFGLARDLKIPRGEAQKYIDSYFARYPGIKGYFAKSVAEAKEYGFVTTLLGRKRYLPDINAKNRQARQFAERNAINSPIQGSAADLIKLAMISISKRLKDEGFKSRMILQVHDELVFETPENEVDRLTKMVVEAMEDAYKLDTPLVVSANAGDNWRQAH